MKKYLQNKILQSIYARQLHILCTAIILLFGFTISLNPTPVGWYQQFMPAMGNKQIADITFIDSLNGIAVANNYPSDSNYVLRTTNSGDSWFIINRQYYPMLHIKFFDNNTGYACAGLLYKTTDGGYTWNTINTSGYSAVNMFILNQDTIWIVDNDSFLGGVFYTSNGGSSWQQQFSGGTQNPNKIYMYNARIGFITSTTAGSPNVYKTTNGGGNWTVQVNGQSFSDIKFIDSLKGWRCWASVNGTNDTTMKKTTDGGLNWIKQYLPYGSPIYPSSLMWKFSVINQDTLIGVGIYMLLPNSTFHGLLYKTINGGANWGYQIPDTNIHISGYLQIQFINKNIGWAYNTGSNPVSGIHTTTGGDTTVYFTGIKKLGDYIPKEYELKQNFPNPFNPTTTIKYALPKDVKVTIKIYDILGKLVITLVNGELKKAGYYEATFNGNNFASGVYFYRIEAGDFAQSKKMVLVK